MSLAGSVDDMYHVDGLMKKYSLESGFDFDEYLREWECQVSRSVQNKGYEILCPEALWKSYLPFTLEGVILEDYRKIDLATTTYPELKEVISLIVKCRRDQEANVLRTKVPKIVKKETIMDKSKEVRGSLNCFTTQPAFTVEAPMLTSMNELKVVDSPILENKSNMGQIKKDVNEQVSEKKLSSQDILIREKLEGNNLNVMTNVATTKTLVSVEPRAKPVVNEPRKGQVTTQSNTGFFHTKQEFRKALMLNEIQNGQSIQTRKDQPQVIRKDIYCTYCHILGHTQDRCFKLKRCHYCHKLGHLRRHCWYYNDPGNWEYPQPNDNHKPYRHIRQESILCSFCQRGGHREETCFRKNRCCFFCGQRGHKIKSCQQRIRQEEGEQESSELNYGTKEKLKKRTQVHCPYCGENHYMRECKEFLATITSITRKKPLFLVPENKQVAEFNKSALENQECNEHLDDVEEVTSSLDGEKDKDGIASPVQTKDEKLEKRFEEEIISSSGDFSNKSLPDPNRSFFDIREDNEDEIARDLPNVQESLLERNEGLNKLKNDN